MIEDFQKKHEPEGLSGTRELIHRTVTSGAVEFERKLLSTSHLLTMNTLQLPFWPSPPRVRNA
jgi:hypothetical protein